MIKDNVQRSVDNSNRLQIVELSAALAYHIS